MRLWLKTTVLLILQVNHISPEQAAQLEESTRGQSRNKIWRQTRLVHITSSNFGSICKAKTRDMAKLAHSLTVPSILKCKQVLHGIKYENVAVEQFCTIHKVETQPCGIFVSTMYPQLAASPDRVIDDEFILEVKCPYSSRNEYITPENSAYLFKQGVAFHLKENHSYYYQIQGQLLCSNRKLCYLVVYTSKDLVVVKVPRDDVFIQDMVPKLLAFFDNHFRDALLDTFFLQRLFRFLF